MSVDELRPYASDVQLIVFDILTDPNKSIICRYTSFVHPSPFPTRRFFDAFTLHRPFVLVRDTELGVSPERVDNLSRGSGIAEMSRFASSLYFVRVSLGSWIFQIPGSHSTQCLEFVTCDLRGLPVHLEFPE